MAVSNPSQFDPSATLNAAFDELAVAMIDARKAVDRVEYLKDRVLAEFERLRDQANGFEMYDERDAAMLFKLDDEPRRAERHLADLRKQFDLPHCVFGRKIRYTKAHLVEIAAALEVHGNRRRSSAERPAALKAA